MTITYEPISVVHDLFRDQAEWDRLGKDSQEEYLENLNNVVVGQGRGPIGKRADGSSILPVRGGADGLFYTDLRAPFVVADQAGITLTTTQKALWLPALSIFPANYWGMVGKTVKLTAMVKVTTGTAGNWIVGMGYGAGDAPAVIVVSGAAKAKIASIGPFLAVMEGFATLRTVGPTSTSGTLSLAGDFRPPLALFLSTVAGSAITFPEAGTTVVSTFDTTSGANALTFQAQNSAGTDTVVTTNLYVQALN